MRVIFNATMFMSMGSTPRKQFVWDVPVLPLLSRCDMACASITAWLADASVNGDLTVAALGREMREAK